MVKLNVSIDRVREGDVAKIIEIVHGLPEWLTPNDIVGVKEAAGQLSGFVARVAGVVWLRVVGGEGVVA